MRPSRHSTLTQRVNTECDPSHHERRPLQAGRRRAGEPRDADLAGDGLVRRATEVLVHECHRGTSGVAAGIGTVGAAVFGRTAATVSRGGLSSA